MPVLLCVRGGAPRSRGAEGGQDEDGGEARHEPAGRAERGLPAGEADDVETDQDERGAHRRARGHGLEEGPRDEGEGHERPDGVLAEDVGEAGGAVWRPMRRGHVRSVPPPDEERPRRAFEGRREDRGW